MNHHHDLDPAEQQILVSMSVLLGRAGLEYQGSFLDVDGRRIHYLDYGDGPPVLLLHGGGAGSAIWFRQIAVLARTHRVRSMCSETQPAHRLTPPVSYSDSMQRHCLRHRLPQHLHPVVVAAVVATPACCC